MEMRLLLDRYLTRQLLGLFSVSVLVFSLIGFFSDAFISFLQDLQKYGIPLQTALRLVALQMPKTISLVLPAGTFLAVLLTFATLNNQFELIAMRMSGIALSRLIRPALVLGFVTTLASYGLNDFVVPWCNQTADALKQAAIEARSLPKGKDNILMQDYDENHRLRQLLFITGLNGRQLKSSTFIDMSKPNFMQIVQAKGGHWYPTHWEFTQANIYSVSKGDDMLMFNHLDSIQMKSLFSGKPQLEGGGELDADSDTQNFWQLANRLKEREQRGLKNSKISVIRLWEKITMPLTCLAIVLTAIPLAITPPREKNNRGFLFAVVVLFVYYLLRSISVALGRADLIPLIVAAWLPVVLMTGFGLWMLKRKSLEA